MSFIQLNAGWSAIVDLVRNFGEIRSAIWSNLWHIAPETGVQCLMLTGAIKSQINKLRDDLWSGGVSNPMTGVEQLTNLLFIKRLDEIQTLEENKAVGLKA